MCTSDVFGKSHRNSGVILLIGLSWCERGAV